MDYLGLPQWGEYLLKGIILFIELSATAVVLTRTGRNPYFAFLLLVPFVQIAAVWYLAFSVWSGPLKKAD